MSIAALTAAAWDMGASLLHAIEEHAQKRASGASVDFLIASAKHQAAKLRDLRSDKDEARFAQQVVEHSIAEAVAYPPSKAVLVQAVPTVGVAGIWGGTRLKLPLRWVNFADFPILVRDVEVQVCVGGGQPQWNIRHGDEFLLAPRSSLLREVEQTAGADVPDIAGGAACDVSISALMCGPWAGGRAQTTRDFESSIWLPAPGAGPKELLVDVVDIDNKLIGWIEDALTKASPDYLPVTFAELDRTLKLRTGAAKERLAIAAGRDNHRLEGVGEKTARLKIHHAPEYLGGGPHGFIIDPDEYP